MRFFAGSADRLTEARDPDLRERVRRGFDRIYLNEVTSELSVGQFARTLRECFECLRPGGWIVMTTLTIDAEPDNVLERLCSRFIVDPAAPNLAQVKEVVEEPPYEVEYEDVTPICLLGYTRWCVDHPERFDLLYLWPISRLLVTLARHGERYQLRGGWNSHVVTVHEPEG